MSDIFVEVVISNRSLPIRAFSITSGAYGSVGHATFQTDRDVLSSIGLKLINDAEAFPGTLPLDIYVNLGSARYHAFGGEYVSGKWDYDRNSVTVHARDWAGILADQKRILSSLSAGVGEVLAPGEVAGGGIETQNQTLSQLVTQIAQKFGFTPEIFLGSGTALTSATGSAQVTTPPPAATNSTDTSNLLAQVRQRESSNNYTANAAGNNIAGPGQPQSHASGAYQFQPATWSQLANASGNGQYANQPAGSAPPAVQDSVAQYAAQHYDPNSTFLWAASAPPGGYPTAGTTSASSSGPVSTGGTSNPNPTTGTSSGAADSNPTMGALYGGEDQIYWPMPETLWGVLNKLARDTGNEVYVTPNKKLVFGLPGAGLTPIVASWGLNPPPSGAYACKNLVIEHNPRRNLTFRVLVLSYDAAKAQVTEGTAYVLGTNVNTNDQQTVHAGVWTGTDASLIGTQLFKTQQDYAIPLYTFRIDGLTQQQTQTQAVAIARDIAKRELIVTCETDGIMTVLPMNPISLTGPDLDPEFVAHNYWVNAYSHEFRLTQNSERAEFMTKLTMLDLKLSGVGDALTTGTTARGLYTTGVKSSQGATPTAGAPSNVY
jgi:hypothetical protein